MKASVVTAQFELGTNMNKAMQDVRGKIDKLKSSLRDEVDDPVVTQVDPTAVAMMSLVISVMPAAACVT